MTSLRKIEANKNNAQASTGPKSAAGKKRSAANARRHGLAVPAGSDPDWAASVGLLADLIAGGTSSPDFIALAQRIAEGQIDVLRVRQVRRHLIESYMAKPVASWDAQDRLPSALLSRLEALDRYERRSMSRRNRAIQDFDTATVLRSLANVRGADSHTNQEERNSSAEIKTTGITPFTLRATE